MKAVYTSLNRALSQLNRERALINDQILAVSGALEAFDSPRKKSKAVATAVPKKETGWIKKRRPRRKMTPAEKKAVSVRMKAYWAKRRASKK